MLLVCYFFFFLSAIITAQILYSTAVSEQLAFICPPEESGEDRRLKYYRIIPYLLSLTFTLEGPEASQIKALLDSKHGSLS